MLEGYTDHPERTRISFFIPARLPSSQYISETGIIINIFYQYQYFYYCDYQYQYYLNIYLKRKILLTFFINISIIIIMIINVYLNDHYHCYLLFQLLKLIHIRLKETNTQNTLNVLKRKESNFAK